MIEALASYFEGSGPAPEAMSWLEGHREVELLLRMCRGSRFRALAAAEGFLSAPPPTQASYRSDPEGSPRAPTADLGRPPGPAATRGSDLPEKEPAPTPALDQAHDRLLRIVALEEDIARLAPWIGVGWHREGSALVEVVHDRLRDLHRLLERAPEIRAVADLIGRMELDRPRGSHHERGGHVSVSGVTLAGELTHALPSELALLADDDLEDLFAMRFSERRLLSLELADGELLDPRDIERRGPALVCIDTSGSMIGEAEELAKAATLAIVGRVLREGRRVEVALFGGEGSIKVARFGPGRAGIRGLFDLLMTSYHGGTDFDGPLGWALDRRLEPGLERADIVLVSDGRARVSRSVRARIEAARRTRQDPLRLVFVRVDTREPTAPAWRGLEPDAFFAGADEIVDIARHA